VKLPFGGVRRRLRLLEAQNYVIDSIAADASARADGASDALGRLEGIVAPLHARIDRIEAELQQALGIYVNPRH
jgi:hypothetical protein